MAEMEIFEGMFQKITEVVLGKPLKGMLDYENWLREYIPIPKAAKSPVSGEIVLVPQTPYFIAVRKNHVNLKESLKLGELKLERGVAEQLDLKNAGKLLNPIKYLASAAEDGENSNLVECCSVGDSHNSFRSTWLVRDNYTAYCFWPRETDYAIGCYYLFASKFCINCYNSEGLTRCFEVSDSNNSSDCYFCHNVENAQNCMFCFNVKSKRYAIGNVEFGKEEYAKIKKLVLEEIAEKLEKNKSLEWNIYSIGCKQ